MTAQNEIDVECHQGHCHHQGLQTSRFAQNASHLMTVASPITLLRLLGMMICQQVPAVSVSEEAKPLSQENPRLART